MQLIKLRPGCHNVQPEVQIGSQPVDLYYEERVSYGTMRVACECKAYEDPLTKKQIAEKIYPRYRPLLDEGLIDRVQIIAPKDPGAVAQHYVRETRGFSFITKAALEAEIIDFSAYVRSLESLYREKGLDTYYIRPVLAEGEDLETRITQWIEGQSPQPVAILAGYGMGKTSFARRLAHITANRFRSDQNARIPILIPLSEIASEQRVEGLLARLFTTDGVVANYSYGLFAELNARGRFLIILDGFDEMKHTMSWGDFKYNFAQLNKLIVPNSRVLLLGRPSAFMSDEEHIYVLAGKRPQGDQLVRVPDAPTYTELYLQEFSVDQAIDFIKAYAASQGPAIAAVRGESYDAAVLQERLISIKNDPDLISLVIRPVQAKMVADLAIDGSVEWRSFTRYELYSEFIRSIIEREVEKPTRSAFSYEARLEFHRALAWVLWNRTPQGSGFKLSDIPGELIRGFRSDDLSNDDDEALIRDLVSGSVLERKTGDAYFFPHRSFIEFLVAEYMCSAEWSADTISSFAEGLTSEVYDFIKESGREGMIASWSGLLNEARGALTIRLIALIAWALNSGSALVAKDPDVTMTPHEVLLTHLQFVDANESASTIVNYLGHAFNSVMSVDAKLSCIRSMLLVTNGMSVTFQQAVWDRIAAFVLLSCLDEFKRVLGRQQRSLDTGLQLHLPFVRIFAASFSSQVTNSCELAVKIDDHAFGKELQRALGHKWNVVGMELPRNLLPVVEPTSLKTLGTLNGRLKMSEEGNVLAQFLRKHPNPSELIQIHKVIRPLHARS